MTKYSPIIKQIITDLAINGLPPRALRLYTPKGQYTGERGGKFDVMKKGTPHYTVQQNKQKYIADMMTWAKTNGLDAAKKNGVYSSIAMLHREIGRLSKEEVAHIQKTYQAISGNQQQQKPEEAAKPAETPKPEAPQRPPTPAEEVKAHSSQLKEVEKLKQKGNIVQSKKEPKKAKPEFVDQGKKIKGFLDDPKFAPGWNLDKTKEGARLVRHIFSPSSAADFNAMRNKDLPTRLLAKFKEEGVSLESPPIISDMLDGTYAIDIPKAKPDVLSLKDIFDSTETEIKNSNMGAMFPIAQDVDGDAVCLNFADESTSHIKICGATGSGKGEVLKAIVVGLSRTTEPGGVEFAVIEPKGAAFNEIRSLKTIVGQPVTSKDDILAMLQETEKEMDRRTALFKSSKDDSVKSLKDYNKNATNPIPRRVIVVDEVKDMLAFSKSNKADKAKVDEIIRILSRIGATGRSAGINMVLASQGAQEDSFPPEIMDHCSTSICLKTNTTTDSNRMLREGNKMDFSAQALGLHGDAYIKIGGAPKIRVQCPLVNDDDIEETNKYLGGKRISK